MAKSDTIDQKKDLISAEIEAFDRQADERVAKGFVPDLRALKKVDWFYNNVWRDPEFVKIHWMPRIAKLIEHAKSGGPKILEVGCGLGMISLELARNGLQVTGVDISPKSIEIANHYKITNTHTENFGSLDYLCCDVNEMEFGKGAYDCVVFFRSLHHFPAWRQIIHKTFEALRPGGRLIISEPVRSHFSKESARFAAVLRTVLPTWESFPDKLGREWTEAEWDSIVDGIYKEYVYREDHVQSPLDNSVSNARVIVDAIREKFSIIEENYSDAFIDKLIGGLRGEHKYQLAKFLKFLDDYVVREKILPPTSLELVAEKTDT